MRHCIILWCLVCCLAACDFAPQNSIPVCPVQLQRNVNVIHCLSPGSWWRIEKPQNAVDRIGYGGIVLVRAFDDRYYAFDLSCPVEASATIRVGRPDGSLMVVCPVCGEEYYLGDGLGLPQRGISPFALLRYRTTCNTAGTLLITN